MVEKKNTNTKYILWDHLYCAFILHCNVFTLMFIMPLVAEVFIKQTRLILNNSMYKISVVDSDLGDVHVATGADVVIISFVGIHFVFLNYSQKGNLTWNQTIPMVIPPKGGAWKHVGQVSFADLSKSFVISALCCQEEL